jgi:extradiol dioxygenase family protein
MIKRLDRLEISTADIEDASKVYEHNFGFSVNRDSSSNEAQIQLAGTEIRLRLGAPDSEGLAGLWLETDDIESVAERLRQAGIEFAPIRHESDRRVLVVERKSSNQVPLFIFDRRV